MTELISLYIAALKKVDWQDINKLNNSEKISISWLCEEGSLTQRLEKKCEALTVELIQSIMLPSEKVAQSEKEWLSESDCLLREVVLRGDHNDWLIGRTLIPKTSMEEQSHNLAEQGTTPLGATVFSAPNVHRDALQFGWVELKGMTLIARRSRLWMNHKPMLVAELFLPDAPIYIKERN